MVRRNKTYFNQVNLKINFPEEEKKLLSEWYKKGILSKYLAKNSNSKKTFSFLDGPITANGPMGVHHAWGRTYKDLYQKYKNMQGYRQRFQNGFDCQGLWVEVEVEKELGFKHKKDIEDFGVAKFVQLCKDRVKKYSDLQTKQSQRLGYFMDWDNSYFTLSDDNNYMIWHFLKYCYENGWIYKGKDAVPWCPRCETAISQHEMLTEDYKEATHESVFLAFPIIGRDNEYLLVWTTTPWTIPANIAVAVDGKLDYSLVKVGEKKYWIATEAVERVFKGEKHEVIKTNKGSVLVGYKYEGAFDDLPEISEVGKKNGAKFHSVIETDNLIMPITTSEGTGLVHTAVSAGTEDFSLGKKLGLPMIPVIEDDASYMKGLGFLSGQNAKNNPKLILDYLKKLNEEGKHFYFKIENYTHRYPACWRCKTELVWKVTDEWYIAMDKGEPTLRQRMIEVAKNIKWLPSFGLERELDWLTNMHDWLISKKNRYWGLALPIWECLKCGNFDVIGSKEELKEKAVEGWKEFEGKSPHKPQIDEVKIKCSKCGEIACRVEPVGNPWLDAGIVSFSTIPGYLTDKRQWERWFPADFITESFPGQFKNWFYALIAMSTALEDEEPTKTILGYGTLLGEDGRPMHKSWGNSIDFDEGADKIGVDVARWMYARANPAENLLFGYKLADEVRRKFYLRLWNVYNFFVTYANLDGWHPVLDANKKVLSTSILDKWILARLDQVVDKVTKLLESFDAYSASGEIEKFTDDLSLWYIRRSRDRVGPIAPSKKDKDAFYSTTYTVLVTISKLLAPFTPFMADFMYQNLVKGLSVHLDSWPSSSRTYEKSLKLIEKMELLRQVVEKAHAIRKEKQFPVRQPLSSLTLNSDKDDFDIDLLRLACEELNVKKILFSNKQKEDLLLDTRITLELEEEAKARELIRKIQEERKKMNLNLTQTADVVSDWLPTNKKLINNIKLKTSSRLLRQGESFEVKISAS